jgi:RNA polymerase sigma-70 factor (ECF subfamily)
MHEDRQIAKRMLNGDEAAFRELFEAFFPRLYRYALLRVNGDREEARDVVQQTFCKAFEALDTYRGEASLYGWMYRICRNTLIDRARKHSARPDCWVASDADDAIQAIVEALRSPEHEEPEHEIARMDLLQRIQGTLDLLPVHYANVLEWKYVEERSVDEIAARLAVAPKAAESLLTRARNAFKEAIVAMRDSADWLPQGFGSDWKG